MRTCDKTDSQLRSELGLEAPGLLDFARREFSQNRPIRVKVSGSSMRPVLEEGDIVTVAPVGSTGVHVRDIVLVSTESGTALIHRVVSVHPRGEGTYALVRGDHSQVTNIQLPLHRVLGCVVALQRKGRGKVIPMRFRSAWRSRLLAWFSQLAERFR